MAQPSKQELLQHLDDHLDFIEKCIKDYKENERLAKRVATTIRVLVHDTQKSTSLLTLLGSKDIDFRTTNAPKGGMAFWKLTRVGMQGDIVNLTPYIGIVAKEVTGTPERIELRYLPIYEQMPEGGRKVKFDNWWSENIYDNKKGYTLSRKQLVLNMVNKDGGAHVDEDGLDSNYASFKEQGVMQFVVNGNLQGFDNIPAYPAVMQIAWELGRSIKDELENIQKN